VKLISIDESVVQAYLDKITPFYQKLSKLPVAELGHRTHFVDEILLRVKLIRKSLKMHRQFDNDFTHLLLLERQIDSWVAEEVKPIVAEWMKRQTKLARSSTLGVERLKQRKMNYGRNAGILRSNTATVRNILSRAPLLREKISRRKQSCVTSRTCLPRTTMTTTGMSRSNP
jgi:hypothetical protein